MHDLFIYLFIIINLLYYNNYVQQNKIKNSTINKLYVMIIMIFKIIYHDQINKSNNNNIIIFIIDVSFSSASY